MIIGNAFRSAIQTLNLKFNPNRPKNLMISIDDIVNEIYRGLLNREPDPLGGKTYRQFLCDGLENGTLKIAEMLRSCVDSPEFHAVRPIESRKPIGSTRNEAEEVLRFTSDQVIAALYEAILDRTPEPQGHSNYVELLNTEKSLPHTIRRFVDAAGLKSGNLAELMAHGRLPANPIQLELSTEQRDLVWRHVAEAWSKLGEREPYFSVLTANEFLLRNLSDDTIEQFYASGEADIDRAEKFLLRHGLRLPKDGLCVDYGCGLGRTTLWLARRCKQVLAIDVSEAHLTIARQALAARGVSNVEFRLLRQRRDLVMKGVDFFHSVIVLQHNPPPVIADILENAFAGLNDGGGAFFQVTTYGMEYSWDFQKYVTDQVPRGETEMHAVPQSVVFSLAARAGCLPMEVQPDGYARMPPWISNTFLIVRPTAATLRGPDNSTGSRGHVGERLRRLTPRSLRRRIAGA